MGDWPLASVKRRRKVRSLMAASLARSRTSSGWCKRSRAHCMTRERSLRGVGLTGVGMNCAWPPVRCGDITRRRATELATWVPKSRATRCRQASMPAALPAEVINCPEST
ncbi:hypothetical protein D9M71_804410 [compost metagenome]